MTETAMRDLNLPTGERPRLVRVPGGHIPVGQYAGTGQLHDFRPDRHVGTSCLACYGWSDDVRHTRERCDG